MSNQAEIKGTKFSVGDLISVHTKIKEGDKIRTQMFEGVVIAIKGRQENKSFQVRKIATGGIGVERIWPVNSPWLEKIEVKKRGKVRRSKLYYLRKRTGKRAIKIKLKKKTVSKNKNEKSAAKKKKAKTG